MEKQARCEAQVYGSRGFTSHRCVKPAKFSERAQNFGTGEEYGEVKDWCGTHAPSKIEAKRQAKVKSEQAFCEARAARRVTRQGERIKDLNEIIASIRAGARSDDSVDATYTDGRSRIERHVTKFSDLYR